MFFISLKLSKRKVMSFTLTALAVVLAITVIPSFSVARTSADTTVNLSASNASERKAFLSQFGWQIEDEPSEVVEVIIPDEFNDVYLKYNEIQISQGFDLRQYCGRRVKRWTYKIVNYPGYEESDTVYANILVYKGKVIGGDVCNVELDGFMHGFALNAVEPS